MSSGRTENHKAFSAIFKDKGTIGNSEVKHATVSSCNVTTDSLINYIYCIFRCTKKLEPYSHPEMYSCGAFHVEFNKFMPSGKSRQIL